MQYVDLEYQGGGVGEYMYYDRHAGDWNDYACKSSPGRRCAKMDCHLPTTHFSLLGIFKEPDYDDWMEQLFKHEGYCLWSDQEYKFMQNYRQSWPLYCTKTTAFDKGNHLYYATKPGPRGTMYIGLYTDSNCAEEYTGETKVEEVLTLMAKAYSSGNSYSNDDDYVKRTGLEEQMTAWNKAFEVFKYCQPCKAYNLVSILAGPNADWNGTGTRYSSENYYNHYRDDDSYNNDEGFTCYDPAGYKDVNQCMKFQTKTSMMPASLSDVFLADEQGTVTGIVIKNVTNNLKVFEAGIFPGETMAVKTETMFSTFRFRLSLAQLLASAIMFCASAYNYLQVRKSKASGIREPLVRFDMDSPGPSSWKNSHRGRGSRLKYALGRAEVELSPSGGRSGNREVSFRKQPLIGGDEPLRISTGVSA